MSSHSVLRQIRKSLPGQRQKEESANGEGQCTRAVSEEVIVKIPKVMFDNIQEREWFKYYRDIKDFVVDAIRRSIENWEKSALAYDTQEETDTKVEVIERSEPSSTTPPETEKTKISQDTKPPGCRHFIGYLIKEHPKKTPIPHECVTCTKINECLFSS